MRVYFLAKKRKFARIVSISADFQKRFLELTEELEIKNKTEQAKALNLPYSTFLKITQYGILPKPLTLVRLADFFAVSLEYLLGRSDRYEFTPSQPPKKCRGRWGRSRWKQLLEEQNETVYRAAETTHIHRNNIAQWLKKGYVPSLDDLLNLAEHFDVSLDYLLGRTDDRNF